MPRARQLSRRVPVTVLAVAVLVAAALSLSVPAVAPAAAAVAEQTASPDGNVAPGATVVQSPSAGNAVPGALVDGSGVAGAAGAGADWTVASPVQSWAELRWSASKRIASVAVVGSSASSAQVSVATLTFGDGSTLTVGGVVSDPARPTIIGFAPVTTRSVRLTITAVTGSGSLSLGELRAYKTGSLPVRAPTGPAPTGFTGPQASPACGPASSVTRLTVRCPTGDSLVGTSTSITVGVPSGYTAVAPYLEPADTTAAETPLAAVTPSGGTAVITANTSSQPPGPFTVRLVATGPGQADQTVFLPLYRSGTRPDYRLASQSAASGRTLVYDDEFGSPVSLSRTGAGADYAAAQPTSRGYPQDFGDAPFADPAAGLGTVGTTGGLLRLGVRPGDGSATYPSTSLVGSMLASARIGGSGFSARYGYFEARVFSPIATGTWPAFWALPSDNLAARTATIAEIDAVELYGVNPRSTCHATHSYQNGNDTPNVTCNPTFASDRAAAGWHVYGVQVTPTQIVYTVDGQTVVTLPQTAGGGAPMFFMLDLALGGGYPVDLGPIGNRASMYVDYVRVYV